jgi:hypothetical protein
MADIFGELIPRLVLNTETDADSPDNETTYGGIRKLIEGLILSIFGTGVSGTVTGISGSTLSDASNFTTDQCNGWTLIMTSGDAIGNFYTIDDTTTNTLVCTGDNLETDGVEVGDTYVVVYDLKVNADGHDHDTVNSKAVVGVANDSIDTQHYVAGSVDQTALGADSVGQSEIKEGNGTASALVGTLSNTDISMQDYCFFPNISGDGGAGNWTVKAYHTPAASYIGRFALYNSGVGSQTYTVYWRYITATDEPFIYAIRDKNGDMVATWACTDPPPGYWGLDKKPDGFIPPIIYDPVITDMEEIILFKYPMDGYKELIEKSRKDNKPIHEHMNGFDYNEKSKLFIAKNLSMI